jgi:dienelactone hydrolase
MKKIGILLGLLASFLLGTLLQIDWYKKRIFPQETKREELKRILGIEEIGDWPEITLLKREKGDGIERRLIGFVSQDGLLITAYLLIPEIPRDRYPIIIAIHGHGSSKEEVCGMVDLGNRADYGIRLAKEGFIVLAPDVRVSKDGREEDLYSLSLILYGKTLNGIRLLDILAFLRYATNLPEVDKERIGCIGWSLGGALAMYLAACDERIKAVYISGYYCSFSSIMARRHSTDNYIPGILSFGDMDEVASLIIPRPIFIESGEKEVWFPIELTKEVVLRLKDRYQKAGFHKRIEWRIFPGGHIFLGDEMVEWFAKWLKE